MATTIVSSRVNNRAQVSLVMPSQAIVADSDEDDGSISPHLNTLRSTNEKAKKSELPHVLVLASTSAMIPHGNGGGSQPRDSIPPGHGDNTARIPDPRATRDEDKTSREQDVGSATDVAAAMPEPEIVGSTSQNDPPSYIPAHLHGLMKPLPQGLAGYRRNGHDSGQATPTGYHSGQATPSGYSSGRSSGQATPTGYNRRIPSSSIPHLLSTSANLAAADPQQQQLIASQLSFMGIDAAFSPTIRSRDQSFAFSVDGDDSAFNPNKAAPTPLQIGQMPAHPQMQHQLALCLKQGLTSPMEGGSCSHSSLSLPSVVSSSRNSPLHPPIFPSPPTRATQTDLNMQLDSKQLSQPPTSAVVSNFSHSSLDQNLEAINAEVARIVPDVGKDMLATKSPSGMGQPPLPSRQLPPSHQNKNMRHTSSAVQPVLYSAINSLERYNAGSFDNKVMIAKARGTYGTQNAFPGVPQKKTEQSSPENNGTDQLGSLTNSGLGSKSSSVASFGREGFTRDSDERMKQLLEYAREDNALIEQVGMEQLVAITDQPSDSRLIKSKSSGNLDDKEDGGTPESLGLLKKNRRNRANRSVTINAEENKPSRRGKRRGKKVGVFRPSSDAYTPRMGDRDLKYKPAKERASVEKISSTMGTIQRPNFQDALRRVAIILHQHIVKIERRFSTGIHGVDDTGLFKSSMREQFNEDNFATPRYKCSMVRVPMARPGVVYSMRKIRVVYNTPTTDEIYDFAHQLFKKVQLSSECSIVCLIYVEKLMEVAKVPLVAETWRPIFLCGLLLASKVWQDLSSWNIEFACVYPQFSLDAINRLELSFLKFIKWDLYISSSLYAKYYFALRSLLEKSGFRDRYNQMVGGIGGIAASEALKVSKRSEAVKEEALQQLSRSM